MYVCVKIGGDDDGCGGGGSSNEIKNDPVLNSVQKTGVHLKPSRRQRKLRLKQYAIVSMTKLKIEPGSIVRVIRDFLTTSEGELCINSGEIIQVRRDQCPMNLISKSNLALFSCALLHFQVEEVIDRHWLLCRTQTRSGSIPSSHVTEVDIGHVDYGSKIFVANSNFDGEQEGDLTLARGTLVIGYEAVDQAWFKGKTLSGEHGVFPISFCWELDPSNYISVIKSQKNTVEKFAQVSLGSLT